MASQDPSTAYGAAPEKPKSFFSSFPSFSMPKLPDFFGTGSTAPAPAPAPSAAEQSSVQPGGRRRRHTKKAGRRRRHTRRGGDDEYKPDITFVPATPVSFPPTQVRKGKGRRRRHTRRGGVETPMQKMKYGPKEYKFLTDGYKLDFPPTQVRRPNVESPPPVQAPKPIGNGRRTRRVKKHSRR